MNLQTQQPFGILLDMGNDQGRYGSSLIPFGLKKQHTGGRNLGPGVNTAGDEMAPFIHADNQTLYFTSSGWPGYGGSD
ncbi:MAG: hypothetical protein FYV88_4190, partial [Bacteroidetes bacterium]|nr:hypothetical protein [Bacteroidota bacterium]